MIGTKCSADVLDAASFAYTFSCHGLWIMSRHQVLPLKLFGTGRNTAVPATGICKKEYMY